MNTEKFPFLRDDVFLSGFLNAHDEPRLYLEKINPIAKKTEEKSIEINLSLDDQDITVKRAILQDRIRQIANLGSNIFYPSSIPAEDRILDDAVVLGILTFFQQFDISFLYQYLDGMQRELVERRKSPDTVFRKYIPFILNQITPDKWYIVYEYILGFDDISGFANEFAELMFCYPPDNLADYIIKVCDGDDGNDFLMRIITDNELFCNHMMEGYTGSNHILQYMITHDDARRYIGAFINQTRLDELLGHNDNIDGPFQGSDDFVHQIFNFIASTKDLYTFAWQVPLQKISDRSRFLHRILDTDDSEETLLYIFREFIWKVSYNIESVVERILKMRPSEKVLRAMIEAFSEANDSGPELNNIISRMKKVDGRIKEIVET